nr:MAG: hypothetical protein EDM05_00015 [Leptolyngbya sp. IPPAS B-1204]
MPRSWWLISIAGILLASGCASKTASKPPAISQPSASATAPAIPPTDAAQSDEAPGQALTAKDFFPDPLVAGSTSVQPLPIPNLIPPTASLERIPQVDSGRPDPFASLDYAPAVTVVRSKSSPAPVPTASVIPTAPVVATAPVLQAPPIVPLPPLVPAPTSLSPLPSVNVPSPVAPRESTAETIEISGVIEVGGKTNVIVKVPEEHTSRYVTVGDRLVNGKVLVKRVEMGLEPVVILEQGGREIVRSVGSSSALIGAL